MRSVLKDKLRVGSRAHVLLEVWTTVNTDDQKSWLKCRDLCDAKLFKRTTEWVATDDSPGSVDDRMGLSTRAIRKLSKNTETGVMRSCLGRLQSWTPPTIRRVTRKMEWTSKLVSATAVPRIDCAELSLGIHSRFCVVKTRTCTPALHTY